MNIYVSLIMVFGQRINRFNATLKTDFDKQYR